MLRYHELLTKAIQDSGLSLAQIAMRVKSVAGIGVHKSYLSLLQNNKTAPGSDSLNGALAQVLSPHITYQELRVAAYREKIPDDVFEILVQQHLEQKGGIDDGERTTTS